MFKKRYNVYYNKKNKGQYKYVFSFTLPSGYELIDIIGHIISYCAKKYKKAGWYSVYRKKRCVYSFHLKNPVIRRALVFG